MGLIVAMLFAAGMAALAIWFWRALFADDPVFDSRWIRRWMIRGLALPPAVWAYLNTGHRPALPAIARLSPPLGAGWFGSLLFHVHYVVVQTAPVLAVASSIWAAVTLGWFIIIMAKRVQEPEEFRALCILWGGLSVPAGALLVYVAGLSTLGIAGLLVLGPLLYQTVSLKEPVRAPVYASAIARMKFGKYREAEQAIIGELEKCESDFEGWLMLASLYARQFNDLPEAGRTVTEICNEPEATPSQIAVALNQLADWQLQLRGDPVAARRALDEISRRLPGTHLARMALLRINNLPATAADWEERQKPKTVRLLPLSDQLQAASPENSEETNIPEALTRANKCVEKLVRDPNDVEVREELAGILASPLGEFDLAVEQIESLIAMPEQSQAKVPGWLAQMAAWEIRRGNHPEAARKHLKRLIREYPQSVQAFAAQRQLSLLEAEERMVRSRS